EEIERYEGRIRYLQAHTAMSTLSVTVHEPLPVVGTAGQSVMGAAVKQAWRNFVALASLVVQSLGVVLPLGVVAIVGWVVTRRWRLARQRAAGMAGGWASRRRRLWQRRSAERNTSLGKREKKPVKKPTCWAGC